MVFIAMAVLYIEMKWKMGNAPYQDTEKLKLIHQRWRKSRYYPLSLLGVESISCARTGATNSQHPHTPLGDEFAIYFKLFLLTVVPILPPSNVPSSSCPILSFLNSSSFPLCIMYIPYLRDTCQLDSYLCTFRAL